MLCIGREEVNRLVLNQLVSLDAVCIDELFFHRSIMQLGVEHIFGKLNMVLQSIGALSIAKGLIEAFRVVS